MIPLCVFVQPRYILTYGVPGDMAGLDSVPDQPTQMIATTGLIRFLYMWQARLLLATASRYDSYQFLGGLVTEGVQHFGCGLKFIY